MIKSQELRIIYDLKLIFSFLGIVFFIAILFVYFPSVGLAAILIILGGIAAIIISARWPETFLLLAIFTNFMKSAYIPGLALGEFGATPYMVFTSLATLGFGIQIITRKRRLILPTGIWFLLLFIAFTTLSLLIAQNFRLAIGAYVRNVLDWMIMILLLQMLINKEKVRKLITGLLIQSVIVVGWGVLAGIRIEVLNIPRRSLFFWQQYQKNDFAAYLGIVLVLAIATFTIAKTRRIKLFALLLLPFVPIGWIFTFSRGGFLAIVVCLIAFLALERNKKLLQQSLIVVALIGLVGVGFITFSSSEAKNLALDGLQSILTGESEAERHTDTIAFRLDLAQTATRVIARYPVLGVGFNQWQFFSPIRTKVYDPQANKVRETGYAIHNRYLGIAANNGLIALSGYLGFLATILVYAAWQRRTAEIEIRTYINVFIAAMLGMQVAMLFAPSVLWEWPLFGIILGLINVNKATQHPPQALTQSS